LDQISTATVEIPPSTPPLFTPKRVAESFAYCEQLTRSHYENFPVGSMLIPSDRRRFVYAIYAFARVADDMADEGYGEGVSTESRLDRLADWGRQLEGCLEGRADHIVFPALATTIHEMRLPIDLLRDLLSAFNQDVVKFRYHDFAEVLDYCRRSANPIGRMILHLFGYRDEERARLSDKVCTALQLTNFWQDVSIDIEKDRIYAPIEDMEKFGVSEDQIRKVEFTHDFARLMSFEVERTRELFREGKPLLDMVGGRLRYELRLTWLGGMSILEKIERAGFDTLHSRPSIGIRDKLRLLRKTLLTRI
jgi:hydroxysqualene synthase